MKVKVTAEAKMSDAKENTQFFCNYVITRKDTFTMVTEGRCVVNCCGEMRFTRCQGCSLGRDMKWFLTFSKAHGNSECKSVQFI